MIDAKPPTDEQLAREAQRGSAPSFEELVRRYQVPLMRFLLRKSPSPREAEDILQETFLRAFQSLDRYDDRWPFKTWLFTISYRLAVSAARKRRATRDVDETYPMAAPGDEPALRVEREDSRQRLWETARRTLGEEAFYAVWLHYAELMPSKQVAEVMGRSWVWVKTTLHRSRKKLMAVLDPPGPIAGSLSVSAIPSRAAFQGDA